MNPVLILVLVVVFVVVLVVLSKLLSGKSASYRRKALERIEREGGSQQDIENLQLTDDNDAVYETFKDFPVIGVIARKLKVSGSDVSLLAYLSILLVIFLIATYVVTLLFAGKIWVGVLIGAFIALSISNIYLGLKIERRNNHFLDSFPDAIDIVVRSVKSGHPLLASLRMIAQNSEPPISTEFQKVVDEVSYGRPLPEALRKMADRIGLLDINFFVVILSVQQDTGGNLAEVLTNLSNIIRKRKQLRLKINAMTSEGRFTAWIFAGIPIVEIFAIWVITPEYLEPLFKTDGGNIGLAIAVGLIVFAIYISKRLCKIDI